MRLKKDLRFFDLSPKAENSFSNFLTSFLTSSNFQVCKNNGTRENNVGALYN